MAALQSSVTRSDADSSEGTAATSSTLGKYRLIAELGQGGMAQVFLALARGPAGFNKLTVIKQIREQLVDDPEFLGMFLDEARLAARLNHPNVVQTNEVGNDGRRYFIAMEYLEGQPLNRIIQRLGRDNGIPLGAHLRVLCEVLAGLHHAHELSDFDGTALEVVHRDVTPHNIFVTYAGQVKIVDFGIAKALSQSTETKAGVLKGKVAYMAPEQARGENVDRRADLFSVGVLLWEALVGARMFKGLTDVVIIQKIVNGQLPSPRSVNPKVDETLDAVCMKALAHNREDRYETAAELQSAIEQALEGIDDRSTVRDLGKLIQERFDAERQRIKSMVEAAANATYATPVRSGEFPTGGSTGSHGALPILHDPGTYDPSLHGERVLSAASTGSQKLLAGAPSEAVPEAAPPAPKPNKMLVPLIAVGLAAALGVGYVVFNKAPPPVPVPPAQAAQQQQPSSFALSLGSDPPGATVTEGDKKLGQTPLAIPIDPNLKQDRTLTITMDGYAPYTYVLSPSAQNQGFHAVLAKAAAAPEKPKSADVEPPKTSGASYHRPRPAAEPASAPVNPTPAAAAPNVLPINTSRALGNDSGN
ncbi:MAG: serine/threonine-protein kinase [Polyangiaceae bacterium]